MADIDDELGLDDELPKQAGRLSSAAAIPSMPASPLTPGVAKPNATNSTPPLTLRGISPQTSQATMRDQAKLDQMKASGSGISQVSSPTGRGILRGLNTVGSIAGAVSPLARNLMTAIPGTEEHHQQLIGKSERALGADLGQETAEAGIGEKQAQAEHTQAETGAIPAQTAHTEAETAAIPATTAHTEAETGAIPSTIAHTEAETEALKNPKPEKPDSPEQQFIDAETKKGIPLQQAVADYAKASHIPEKPAAEPGSFMPLYDEKGHVTGAWNPKDGRVIKNPDLPGTTAQGQGIADKGAASVTKAEAPYQQMVDNATQAHELADMATKGNASADVDLVLSFFKMMRGTGGANIRFTQQEQNLILGARNAGQGLEAVAQKVYGGGQPLTPEQRQHMVAVIDMHAKAAQSALERMRGGQGNTQQQTGGKDLGAAPAGKAEGATGTLPDGTKVMVKGGRMVAQ